MSISDRLAEIHYRTDNATDGPWKIETHYGMCQSRRRQIVVPGWMTPIAVLGQENPYGDPDAEFIAHARTDVPWLIEQVRKRDATLRAVLRAVLDLHSKSPGQRWVGFPRADRQEHYCMADQQAWPCDTHHIIAAALDEHFSTHKETQDD